MPRLSFLVASFALLFSFAALEVRAERDIGAPDGRPVLVIRSVDQADLNFGDRIGVLGETKLQEQLTEWLGGASDVADVKVFVALSAAREAMGTGLVDSLYVPQSIGDRLVAESDEALTLYAPPNTEAYAALDLD